MPPAEPHPVEPHLPEDTLHALADGELAPGPQAAARAHLHECPACAWRLDQLRALFAVVEALPDAAPARDHAAEVRAILRDEASRRRGWGDLLAWRGWLPLQALGGAAALLAAWPRLAPLLGTYLATLRQGLDTPWLTGPEALLAPTVLATAPWRGLAPWLPGTPLGGGADQRVLMHDWLPAWSPSAWLMLLAVAALLWWLANRGLARTAARALLTIDDPARIA